MNTRFFILAFSLRLPPVNIFRMINNEMVSMITRKIRAVRVRKNMTIQQLAEKTKVTKGLLSKIENSRTIPSLPVFVQILQSLDISLKEFFEDMIPGNGKDYLLVRKDQYTFMEREGRKGFDYRYILSQNISPSTMEIALLTIKPGATGRPTITDGFEFKFLISGTCEYHINNQIVKMEEGDSIYFDASVPHLPLNPTDRDAIMLVVYFIVPKS